MTTSYRTLIIGEVRVNCDGIARLLSQEAEIRVVGVATSWAEAQDLMRRVTVEAILLDVARGELLSHVRAFRQICDSLIIAFGVGTDEEVLACARAGVNGVCERTASARDLVSAIARASRGELEISGRATAALFRRAGSAEPPRSPRVAAALTERESDVLVLLQQALPNKEIAKRLGVQPATVKNHVHNVLTKLGVSRRGEAILRPVHSDRGPAFAQHGPKDPDHLSNDVDRIERMA